jgi:Zn-dependent M28 family amino/carboxypeptidase
MNNFISLLVLCQFGLNTVAQNFNEASIRKHISFLASDKLKGRGTSTPEEKEAADYIAAEFKKAGLTAFNRSYLKPFTFKKSTNPHDSTAVEVKERSSNNVVGFLDNKAPYTIVIGAHYDHLGLGEDHNSLEANPEGKIHNGADDNASGTTGVIELANYFSSNKKTEPYNFLFICFSGEELGLIGSKKWCENPDIDLSKINYMVNMDMIGRLNDSTKKIVVYGVGTSPFLVPMIESVPTSFSVKKDSSGVGPSDQTSFYLKDIPVLHFFTGQHSDYHKPSDDADKINYAGEAQVLDYIVAIIEKSFEYQKLTFSLTRTPDTGRISMKVTMGVMPDYTFEGEGMRIDGVTNNKPAFKAGVQKGDIVKKLGDSSVKDVQTYMKALSNYKKGDTTTLEILRSGETKVLNLTF